MELSYRMICHKAIIGHLTMNLEAGGGNIQRFVSLLDSFMNVDINIVVRNSLFAVGDIEHGTMEIKFAFFLYVYYGVPFLSLYL